MNLSLTIFKEKFLKKIFLTNLMSTWKIQIKIWSLECLKIIERWKSKILTILISYGLCHKNLTFLKIKNKSKSINNLPKPIKTQKSTIRKMIRKNNRNQVNKQIKELQYILAKNSNVDAHLAGEVKRCKSKTNFSRKSKKFRVKKYKKRNKSNRNSKNTNNLILNFWEESDKRNK